MGVLTGKSSGSRAGSRLRLFIPILLAIIFIVNFALVSLMLLQRQEFLAEQAYRETLALLARSENVTMEIEAEIQTRWEKALTEVRQAGEHGRVLFMTMGGISILLLLAIGALFSRQPAEEQDDPST